jgi:hypothetical protein
MGYEIHQIHRRKFPSCIWLQGRGEETEGTEGEEVHGGDMEVDKPMRLHIWPSQGHECSRCTCGGGEGKDGCLLEGVQVGISRPLLGPHHMLSSDRITL